jgi:ribonucleoside-diphosphate reductase alpha chain
MGTGLSRFIWETRYRHHSATGAERSIEESWHRVAAAAASVETDPARWTAQFLGILRDFRFLPGGRILAGAGTGRAVTLFNCFVMGTIDDSIAGIFDALKEGALTMQQGGGVGYDFSTLRPAGARARTTGMIASGPVPFLSVWDAACRTLLSTGARRGAMMATLRCDHPDIEAFIDAKRDPQALQHFNLSVLVTDEFMRAVRTAEQWPLVFPARALDDENPAAAATVMRRWSGMTEAEPCRILRIVPARAIWQRIVAAAHASAEPGVLFIDRVNEWNNLGYRETLSATNPCGEMPLPPYGGCNLGSLNLATFVRDAFTETARLDLDALAQTATVATRFLDDIIEISRFPLPQQRETIRAARRIGLGITGLADALAMLGVRYDSAAGRAVAANAMRTIRDAAYWASVELAREKGPFPAFDADRYCRRPFIAALPIDVRAELTGHGIRNSHLTAIAPTGTISLLAGNVSSGIEPIRATRIARRIRQADGSYRSVDAVDYAFARWREQHGEGVPLPASFVFGDAVSALDQLRMLAALQPLVDSGISKTVALPRETGEPEVARIFAMAHEHGLKGCTVYRESSRASIFGGDCSGGACPR